MSRTKSRLVRRVAYFVGGGLAACLLVWGGISFLTWATSLAGSDGSSVAPSREPTSESQSPTPLSSTLPVQPEEALDETDEEVLPAVTNPPVSDEPFPSNAQVWAYEQAYYTVDPSEREELIRPLVTEQYLAEDLSRDPPRFEGIEVHVVVEESYIVYRTVSDNRFTCVLTTQVFLETTRNGATVNSFQGPQHMSAWVNTVDGWRVASDLGEQ